VENEKWKMKSEKWKMGDEWMGIWEDE